MIRKIGVVSSVIAFAACLVGGLWILFNVGISNKEDAVWTGLGLYFIGKAFFVGPMLLITVLRNG